MTIIGPNICHMQATHRPQALYTRAKVGHLQRWPISWPPIFHWTYLYILVAGINIVVVKSVAVGWHVVFVCGLRYQWSYRTIVCSRWLIGAAVTYFPVQRYYVGVFICKECNKFFLVRSFFVFLLVLRGFIWTSVFDVRLNFLGSVITRFFGCKIA